MSEDVDWKRVFRVWKTYKENHWCPKAVLFVTITDLRKIDRGIDYPLRRLLDAGDERVRVYGAPTHLVPPHPFRWNEKHWTLIGIKENQE